MMTFLDNPLRCRQCDRRIPAGYTVTCGRSACQEAEAAANHARAHPQAARAKRSAAGTRDLGRRRVRSRHA
jgi:hypothetical protein